MNKVTLEGVEYTPVLAKPGAQCRGCVAGATCKFFLCEALPCAPARENGFNYVIFIKEES